MGKRYIFFCASLGRRGGAERVISILSAAFAARGKTVGIVTYYDEKVIYPIDNRVQIISVEGATKSRNMIRNILWMRSFFHDNALLICSFISSFNMMALVATMGLSIPVIVSERTDPTRKGYVYRWARDFLYGFADTVVAQTQASQAYFSAKIRTRCARIYNPISPVLKEGNALLHSKEPMVVSVGRLETIKNHVLLLRAFKRIKGRFPQYRLVIYGEGACRKQLEKFRDTFELGGAVELPGDVNNVFEEISSAQMFVLPSDFEGMPNALLEAMCLGLPVVSTRVSGAVEVIENEENGLLVDTGDEVGLATAMERLIMDKEMRDKIAKNAAKLAVRLNADTITNQWMKMFSAVEKKKK